MMTSECKGFVYNLKTVPKYSIVVPLHNEEENVTDLYDRLKAVMEAHGENFEIVLVDDGSSDQTFAMLREIAAVDSRVTVVKLRRNFGQTAGLAAGFDHARGEYIIAMDGDLQHDPQRHPHFFGKDSRRLRHRQRLAQSSRRQFLVAPHSLAHCQLDDG